MYVNEYQTVMLAQTRQEQLLREADQFRLVKLARQVRRADKKAAKTTTTNTSNRIASATR